VFASLTFDRFARPVSDWPGPPPIVSPHYETRRRLVKLEI
jgi:hypothetical protein